MMTYEFPGGRRGSGGDDTVWRLVFSVCRFRRLPAGSDNYYTDMQRITANRGFTLLELLITMAIAALLMTLAVPSMKSIMERNAVSNQVNTFLGSLRYARSEAIKLGAPVVMCRSANPEAASPACADAAGSWATGWVIFVNRDLDASNVLGGASTGDALLRVQPAIPDSGGITSTAAPAVHKFVFRPTGMMTAGGASSFTFDTFSLSAERQRKVCVSMQGRARALATSASACSGDDV